MLVASAGFVTQQGQKSTAEPTRQHSQTFSQASAASAPRYGGMIALSRRWAAMALLPGLAACSGLAEIDAAMRRFEFGQVFGSARAAPEAPPPGPPALVPILPRVAGPPKEAEPPAEVMDIPIPDAPAPDIVQRPAAPPVARVGDPALRQAALIRTNPWVTRFWAELTQDQQGRVRRAFARRGIAAAPAGLWDPLGLSDRVRLLFGEG